LLWWEKYHKTYKYVWAFAEHVFCVLASSTPIESVFSVASLVARKKRVLPKPENVDMLVTLRKNFDMVDWDPMEGM
jgi:hypothetical protein